MIKAVQSSKGGRGHKKHNQDTITEYLTSINKLEKIDRPNSLLFKASVAAGSTDQITILDQAVTIQVIYFCKAWCPLTKCDVDQDHIFTIFATFSS